jgi:hypothetical protein
MGFAQIFAKVKMMSKTKNIIKAGNWAMYEWRDPLGLLGCSFFEIENGKISIQRRKLDKIIFLSIQGLPVPTL